MVISEQHNYIFIAVPKTGSTSVEAYLLENDPTAVANTLRVGDREVAVGPHASAAEIKAVLGPRFDRLYSFGFVRDPDARFLSLYSFYRQGRAARRWEAAGRPIRDVRARRVMAARLLPFQLWALMYPYRSCRSFLADRRGRILVSEVGRFENLESDLARILEKVGLALDKPIPHLNPATQREQASYRRGGLLDRLLALKFRHDRAFYGPPVPGE